LEPEDETQLSEISILPDGRVCIFGASRQVIDAVAALNPSDPAIRRRVERLQALGGPVVAVTEPSCEVQPTHEAFRGRTEQELEEP